MEFNHVLQNDALWKRLQKFSPDNSDVDYPFSKKLEKEENWTEAFTRKAIDEYKKFVYLCCILPNGASPSTVVDKVWHMHLTYTRNYWEEFCPAVLQKKLHHNPSEGGINEQVKHRKWFDETLNYYQEIFGQEPPKDIWSEEREKLRQTQWLNRFKVLSLLSVIFLVCSCSEAVQSFLSVFFIIPGFIILIYFLHKAFGSKNDQHHSNKKDSGDNSSGAGCGGDSSSGCSSSCGGSCGSGCGGCGGGGD